MSFGTSLTKTQYIAASLSDENNNNKQTEITRLGRCGPKHLIPPPPPALKELKTLFNSRLHQLYSLSTIFDISVGISYKCPDKDLDLHEDFKWSSRPQIARTNVVASAPYCLGARKSPYIRNEPAGRKEPVAVGKKRMA